MNPILAPLFEANGDEPPLYLSPLNLVWSRRGKEADLSVFATVAEDLKYQAGLWNTLILDSNWRMTLVGCTCLLVSGNTGFRESLEQEFREGSWVAPQVAVTLGLLHPATTTGLFKALTQSSPPLRTRQLVSAISVGRLLNIGSEHIGEVMSFSSPLDEEDAAVTRQIVLKQWAFWSENLSRL